MLLCLSKINSGAGVDPGKAAAQSLETHPRPALNDYLISHKFQPQPRPLKQPSSDESLDEAEDLDAVSRGSLVAE